MPQTLYNPVTPAIVAELRAIAGAPNVLYGEPERMLDYAHDETHGAQYTHMPEVVVKPDGASEIAEIMRLANRQRIPVTPRGPGSGLSGGAGLIAIVNQTRQNTPQSIRDTLSTYDGFNQ